MNEDAIQNYRGVFDGRLGFGRKPALLIVDFLAAYTEPASPLYAPTAMAAVCQTAELREIAWASGLPVVFTRVLYDRSGLDGGLFVQKVPVLRGMIEGAPLAAFVPDLEPGATDIVIVKQYASAFFGTSLASMLTAQGVDTVVICGVSTSGCVRATAVDAMQHGFRPIVPRECVADRHEGPHEANLFDINAKYGDVMGVDEVIAGLRRMVEIAERNGIPLLAVRKADVIVTPDIVNALRDDPA